MSRPKCARFGQHLRAVSGAFWPFFPRRFGTSATCQAHVSALHLPRTSAATGRSARVIVSKDKFLTSSFAVSSFWSTHRATAPACRPHDPLWHRLAAQLYKMEVHPSPSPSPAVRSSLPEFPRPNTPARRTHGRPPRSRPTSRLAPSPWRSASGSTRARAMTATGPTGRTRRGENSTST